MTRKIKTRLTSVGLAVALTLFGLVLPMPTKAETVVNESIPLGVLAVFVPCANGGAGEIVNLSGDLHFTMQLTIAASGNVHIKFHNQPQGVSGVGLTTGLKYQGTGVTQDETDTHIGEEFTSINNFRIIGQGPGNNFLLHTTAHFTINENGDMTSFVDNSSINCK